MERDVLSINGRKVLGSIGYGAVVRQLADQLRSTLPMAGTLMVGPAAKVDLEFQALASKGGTKRKGGGVGEVAGMGVGESKGGGESDGEGEGEGESLYETFAKRILTAVNRTESGRRSFALVTLLCRNDAVG